MDSLVFMANALHEINARSISFHRVHIFVFLSVHVTMSFSPLTMVLPLSSRFQYVVFILSSPPFNQAKIAYLYHHRRKVLLT